MKLIREVAESIEYIEEMVSENKKALYITGPFMEAGIKNRNGRIYPLNVMEKEVGRYKNEVVSHNRAYGELNHPCFGPTAKALTNNGWKSIKDVSLEDHVMSLNPETGKSEFVPVEKININPFQQKMLRLKNRTFDTLVTPYHKFLVEYRNGKKYFITAAEIQEAFEQNISKMSKFCIPKSAEFLNTSPDTIPLAEKEFKFKEFVEFLGIYLAEGCTYKRKDRNHSYKIQLFQNVGDKADIIDGVVNALHPEISWNRYEKDGKVTWTSHDRGLAEYLHQFGKAHEKYIDPVINNKLDAQTAETLLTSYHLGDGRYTGHGNYKNSSREVFSTSQRLASDLSVVAVKAGYSYHTYDYLEENDVVIENRIIKAGSKRRMYFVKLLTSENIWLDPRHLTIEEEDYNGDVYCLTTKYSTFLVEDNGYCFWTGNCGPQINLERACILIKELNYQSDGKVMGKARVTETPSGNIVRGLMESGANLGVSSRALGSVRQNNKGIMEVQDDFRIITPSDVVADPSAPNAFVKGIMEGVEFFYNDDTGEFFEQCKKEMKRRKISRTNVSEQLERDYYKFFENLIKSV